VDHVLVLRYVRVWQQHSGDLGHHLLELLQKPRSAFRGRSASAELTAYFSPHDHGDTSGRRSRFRLTVSVGSSGFFGANVGSISAQGRTLAGFSPRRRQYSWMVIESLTSLSSKRVSGRVGITPRIGTGTRCYGSPCEQPV
jgi:hypothetical protein